MSTWCRACGQLQPLQSGSCTACSADLEVGRPDSTPIGLVYEVRGKLGLTSKQGVCTSVEGQILVLHFSTKDKEAGRIPDTTHPTDLVSADLGPATRLLFAAQLQGGKHSWDGDVLRQRSAELCSDIRVLRRLVDDALQLGWEHIVDWAPISHSEKAWRTAHHAATIGNLESLRGALSRLPKSGYAARSTLLLPHLGAIHRDAGPWLPLLDSIVESGADDAEAVRAAAVGTWDAALGAAKALLPEGRRGAWLNVVPPLEDGQAIPPSLAHDTPAWTAANLFSASGRSLPLDSAVEQLAVLEPALWDDLIDTGRITKAASLTSFTGGLRTYLLARLNPAKLSDPEVRDVGHIGELARRIFLSRDRATLSGLEPTSRVKHYQALLEVIEGSRPDPDRLDAATVQILELPAQTLVELKDGATKSLPAPVVADPSLWPVFADVAITGKLLPDPTLAPNHPLNVWVGLHRLIGLIWEGDLPAAVEHGMILSRSTTDLEQQSDEVLNLTAFALYQQRRVDEALKLLERALEGIYSENLLVNASIVAGEAHPEVGIRYLARLVDEAPTPDLQRAGLDRAITLWEGADLDFPQVLVPAMQTVLNSPQEVEDYLRVGKIAVGVAPQIVASLRNPGGEFDGPYRLIQIRGRWKTDQNMLLNHLAEEYIRLYKTVGRVEWFMNDWKTWIETIHSSVFVDFGEALGSAQWIDTVLMTAPELLPDDERFLLAPQAGAHIAALLAQKGDSLSDAAMQKFFYGPIQEFLKIKGTYNPNYAEYLASSCTLCIGSVGINRLRIGREAIAAAYNPLVDRLRWDIQNRYAITNQMRNLVNAAEGEMMATLRTIITNMRQLGSEERGDLTQALSSDVDEWQNEINGLRRNL